MMLNAPHILETALLILVAFLIGCVAGYLVRRAVAPKGKAAGAQPAEKPAAQPSGPQLVVAPEIAPLPVAKPKRSPAERLAAAAGRSPGPDAEEAAPPPVPQPVMPAPATMEPPVAPAAEIAATDAPALRPTVEMPDVTLPEFSTTPSAAPTMQPAHVAGEATSGVVVVSPHEAPAAPPVAPEPPAGPVRAEDVPPIDEAAHVVPEPQAPPVAEPLVVPPAEPSGPAAEPEPPAPVAPGEAAEPEEDAEAAARRAIEGGWTPRRTAARPARAVPHPEQPPSAEVEQAMAGARSAVASATAAAEAAIAGSDAPTAAAEDLGFAEAGETAPKPFLETEDDAAGAVAESPGLDFEPQRPLSGFGRPEGLAAPRDGVKDDLKQIKGITPALESALNHLGIFHLDQVAAWDQKALVWLDHHLGLKGRAGREKWVDQARALMRGRPSAARPVRR